MNACRMVDRSTKRDLKKRTQKTINIIINSTLQLVQREVKSVVNKAMIESKATCEKMV